MRPELARAAIQTRLTASPSTSPLRQFLEGESELAALLRTLRMYVAHAHLASGDAVAGEALELLNRVVVEALEHEDRFDPTRQPRAWLLGIAANTIKREQVERAKRAGREPSIGATMGPTDATGEIRSEDEMFDRLAALAKAGPEQDLDANEEARALLALVSREADRQVLRLAVLHDLDGAALGKALGISSGAARVRLHRAINRLRHAYHHRVTSNRGKADG